MPAWGDRVLSHIQASENCLGLSCSQRHDIQLLDGPEIKPSNLCKMYLDLSHVNHECCSPLWIQHLPIGINRKLFYPLGNKKGEGVTTVNRVSLGLGHAARATNK